jgi:ketosteroid isomerase-like protein
MSKENVELILGLQLTADVDVAHVFGDDDQAAALSETVGSLFHPEFECATWGLPEGERTYAGLEGLRDLFLDWYAPWATYRVEIEEAVDLGDRVLLLTKGFGRIEGSTAEVEASIGNIWSIRDGRIVRFDAYLDRAEALEAAGLGPSGRGC